MNRLSKNLNLDVIKQRIDAEARKLVAELSNYDDGTTDYERWREPTSWKYGYKDNSNEMLNAVESYVKDLMGRIAEVRNLQVALDQLKAIRVDDEEEL